MEKEHSQLIQWRQYFNTALIQSVLADVTMIVVSILGLRYYLHQSFLTNGQVWGLAFFTSCLILTVISFYFSRLSCHYKILELYKDQMEGYATEKVENITEMLHINNIASLIYFGTALCMLVVFR